MQAAEKYGVEGKTSTHVEDLPLSRVCLLQRGIYAPTAFVVQNVGANLSDFDRAAIAVQIVILDLEVLSHGNENG